MAWRNKRLQLFIATYVMALVMLAGVGYFYTDYTIKAEHHEALREQSFHSDVAYVNLPRMNVTLPTIEGRQSGHVRIDISLAVEKKYMGRVEDMEPRITDRIINYVRGLDFDSLSQPRAVQQLHQQLLEQATSASNPLPIVDIIFNKFVIL